MDAQIRLAERQGLLTGHGLSMVQVTAVYLLELRSMFYQRDQNTLLIKNALVAYGGYPAFTELFVEETRDDEDAAKALTDESGDDGPTLWKFEQNEDFDPEEADRLLDELLGETHHSVTGREIVDWGDKK